MLQQIELYFLLFITYSILGWIIEVVLKYIDLKKYVNRGFLIGPYLPIYGFGSILITLLLQRYNNDTLALFLFSIAICSILEYATSFIMEKIFNARWWDYSTKLFNINGRICLETMIPFGFASVIVIKVLNPILISFYTSLNSITLLVISIIFLIVIFIDFILSTKIIISIKSLNIFKSKDNTEQISKIVMKKIKNLDWGQKRLLSAFPDMKKISTKIIATKEKATRAIVAKKNKIQSKIKRRTNGKNKNI